jgi:glycosyltransferase involved in cell wall biosynthesis
MNRPRLLYLGYAFPPGMAALFPGRQPAGHAMETQLLEALRDYYEIRSVGVFDFQLPAQVASTASSPGLPHALVLLDKPPELLHRWRSCARLRQQFLAWQQEGWAPDLVLVLNLTPVYNVFITWLAQANFPSRRILLLSDSAGLGRRLSWSKRLRYRFKPFYVPDGIMADRYHACIGLSRSTESFFNQRRLPWIWMPGGCLPSPAPPPSNETGPIVFGYFGALAAHTGIRPLLDHFLAWSPGNLLRVCGYGKLSLQIEQRARQDHRLKFHGLLPSPQDCLVLARECDVLINPRPAGWGNENSFPSKIFQYALSARAILSTRLSGVPEVLGDTGCYFDENDFAASLPPRLTELAGQPRADLRQRGLALHHRAITEYSWARQAGRLNEFFRQILDSPLPQSPNL